MSPRRLAPVTAALGLGLALGSAGVGCTAEPEPVRLILLVSVDTLRTDRLGAYGSKRDLTPRLDELARRSLVFTGAFAASSFTFPSVAAILSGRYPGELGLWSNESKLPATTPTVASRLRTAGWRTAAVVSNIVLHRASGLARGFDLFDDELPQRDVTRSQWERTAAATTDAALSAIDACTEGARSKCFVWIHYQDPHGPYTPSEALRSRYLERERLAAGGARSLAVLPDQSGIGGIPRYQYLYGHREVAFYRAGYDGEVRTADEQIGRLLDGVSSRGLDRGCAVLFTADHGESLGENDYWFAHGERLSDPIVSIPLLIAAPGIGTGRRQDAASQVDIHATLLGLAGLAPEPAGRGRDLLALGAASEASTPFIATLGGASVLRYALVDGVYRLTVSERSPGSLEWDTQLTRRDGGAADEIEPSQFASLRARLLALIAETGESAGQKRELSDEHRARLRALGYLE